MPNVSLLPSEKDTTLNDIISRDGPRRDDPQSRVVVHRSPALQLLVLGPGVLRDQGRQGRADAEDVAHQAVTPVFWPDGHDRRQVELLARAAPSPTARAYFPSSSTRSATAVRPRASATSTSSTREERLMSSSTPKSLFPAAGAAVPHAGRSEGTHDATLIFEGRRDAYQHPERGSGNTRYAGGQASMTSGDTATPSSRSSAQSEKSARPRRRTCSTTKACAAPSTSRCVSHARRMIRS